MLVVVIDGIGYVAVVAWFKSCLVVVVIRCCECGSCLW